MAFKNFKMPSNFRGFPSCPNCGCKDFKVDRDPTNFEHLKNMYICENCNSLLYENELVYPHEESELVPELPQFHRDNAAWNSPEMKRRVEETCQEMHERGEKVIRVRRPSEL